MICKYFLALGRLPFHFIDKILWSTKVSKFSEMQFILILFFCCFWCHIQDAIAKYEVIKIYPCVFAWLAWLSV